MKITNMKIFSKCKCFVDGFSKDVKMSSFKFNIVWTCFCFHNVKVSANLNMSILCYNQVSCVSTQLMFWKQTNFEFCHLLYVPPPSPPYHICNILSCLSSKTSDPSKCYMLMSRGFHKMWQDEMSYIWWF